MGVFNDALDTVTAEIQTALGADIEVKDHPGRFTDKELGQILTKRKAVRVAIEDIPGIKVEGDGIRGADIRFIAFVLCADQRGEDRHRAATEIVEELAALVPFNRWGRESMFRAVTPDSVQIENLYSGEISNGKGLAWWAVSWNQTTRREG